jgi:hypothetical protein
MSYLIDDVARTLAGPMPRRKVFRYILGALLGGTVFAPLAMANNCGSSSGRPDGCPCTGTGTAQCSSPSTCKVCGGGGSACTPSGMACCVTGGGQQGTGGKFCVTGQCCCTSAQTCSNSTGTNCTNVGCVIVN